MALPRGAMGLSAIIIVEFPDHTHLLFFRHHNSQFRLYDDLISKFDVGLKSLLRQRLLEPEFYGDLMYNRSCTFSAQFIKIIPIIKRLAITLIYCNRLHAWWFGSFAFLFYCTSVDRTSDYLTVPT